MLNLRITILVGYCWYVCMLAGQRNLHPKGHCHRSTRYRHHSAWWQNHYTFSVCVCVCLSLCLSPHSVFLCLSLTVFLCLSLSLSPSYPFHWLCLGSLNTLSEEGGSLYSDSHAIDHTPGWTGQVETHQASKASRNEFLQDMDKLDEGKIEVWHLFSWMFLPY